MKDRTRKIISTVLCIVLGCIIGIGGCFLANGIAIRKAPNLEIQNMADGIDGTIIHSNENHGISLMSAKVTDGISPQAESGYLLTATIYPATAIALLDWTVEFKNATSAWANGKSASDYIKVTPTSDGALTARVECLKAFSEQIIVKAASRTDNAIYGTCTADYAKRLTYLTLSGKLAEPSKDKEYGGIYALTHDEMDTADGVSVLPLYSADSRNWSDFNESADFLYSYGAGTVTGTVIKHKVEVKATEEFLNVYRTGSYYSSAGECLLSTWYELSDWTTKDGKFCYAQVLSMLGASFTVFSPDYGYPIPSGYREFVNAIKTYTSPDFNVRVTVTMQYGDTQEESVFEFPCMFDRYSSVYKVNSISLDKSELIY